MQLSPVLAEVEQYPFTRLDEWRAGRDVIDFGVGDPREVTPAFIRRALAAAIEERSSYPRATGLPELRTAIAAWIERRFGVDVDPDRELVPTFGSKEAIFSFAHVALGEKRGVAVPEPGYPVYERGARFAGGTVLPCRCGRRTAGSRISTPSTAGTSLRSSGSATRTIPRAPPPRSPSTRSLPGWRAS